MESVELCGCSRCRPGSSRRRFRGGASVRLAVAPFPLPAHRTGRADFWHPALRLGRQKAPTQHHRHFRLWLFPAVPAMPAPRPDCPQLRTSM